MLGCIIIFYSTEARLLAAGLSADPFTTSSSLEIGTISGDKNKTS